MEFEKSAIDMLEQLLAEKSFRELNENERDLVHLHIGGEAEYEELRSVGGLMSGFTPVRPAPSTLNELRRVMRSSGKVNGSIIRLFSVRIPAYTAMIAAGLAALLVMLLQPEAPTPVPREIKLIAYDTVYLPSDRDTVYIEKVVYREKEASQSKPAIHVVRTTPAPERRTEGGVSMQEQEELETLLVSGS